MKIDDILAALEHNEGTFPRRALRAAIENKEFVIPTLLQELDYSINNIETIADDSGYIRHIFALYLLAQFRITSAYPLIVEFFSLPGELTQHVTGDVITEDLSRILASTFDGNVSLLESLIEDDGINEYVRGAALQALVILWGHEILTRRHVIGYFKTLLMEKFAGEDSGMWSALVSHSLAMSPGELEQDIERAFDQQLIETFYVGRQDFRDSLGLSDKEALAEFKSDRRHGLIDDTISEMEKWACFQKHNFQKHKKSTPGAGASLSNRGSPKTGRNDPCPCGSKRKYKKCCL